MLWIVAAPGPSLTPELAEQTRGHRVIAVNDAYRLLPWADVLYAADADWWRARNGCREFAGERLTTFGRDSERTIAQFGLTSIQNQRFVKGFSLSPGVIYRGQSNSGFQAVNVALLRDGNPVVLIGFDMHGTHFFGQHEAPLRSWDRQKQESIFARWIEGFRLASDLLPPHIRIINATPGSALTCFPIMTLDEALNARHRQHAMEDLGGEAHRYAG